jgi:hypothetical protein
VRTGSWLLAIGFWEMPLSDMSPLVGDLDPARQRRGVRIFAFSKAQQLNLYCS